MATLHLQRNKDLLLRLMQHLDCRISDEELRVVTEKAIGATGKRNDPCDRRS